MTDLEILKSYIPMARFIAAVTGPCCEVAIHNLSDLDHSIIFIENGYLTGRKVGDPLLDFNSHTMFDPEEQNFKANYGGIHSINDRVFRFSTYYIKNNADKLIGLLNTNYDISGILKLKEVISHDLLYENETVAAGSNAGPTAPAISTKFLIDQTFDDAMSALGYSDPKTLATDEKIHVVKYFFEHNIFDLKGAVSIIAKKLSVSEPTIYRYRHSIQK